MLPQRAHNNQKLQQETRHKLADFKKENKASLIYIKTC